MRKFSQIKSRQEGVTLIEYVLIASLIAVASVVIMQALGVQIGTVFQTICTKMGGSC
jgi:Flp pilus assembly pilin Flp